MPVEVVLYFFRSRQSQLKIIPLLFACRENFLKKCTKTPCKICKHLMQQKVQQKVHNNHDVFWF